MEAKPSAFALPRGCGWHRRYRQRPSADPNHEAGTGRGAAPDIESEHVFGFRYLVSAGPSGHLAGAVQHHPHPRWRPRVTQADQATAGIDWEVAVSADAPASIAFQLARRGQAVVVDGHVFGHRETIMGFQAVEIGSHG